MQIRGNFTDHRQTEPHTSHHLTMWPECFCNLPTREQESWFSYDFLNIKLFNFLTMGLVSILFSGRKNYFLYFKRLWNLYGKVTGRGRYYLLIWQHSKICNQQEAVKMFLIGANAVRYKPKISKKFYKMLVTFFYHTDFCYVQQR